LQTRMARIYLAAIACIIVSIVAAAQAPQKSGKGSRPPTTKTASEPTPPDAQQEIETVRIDTNLVTVPVIATNVNGMYIPDLAQEDFNVFEDGVKQNIAFFATISTPFQVVLMLDTSASTEANLGQIQHAATAFVNQLQSGDQVKVISFDDEVRDLSAFTSDRTELKAAIAQTKSGKGTKLYDAFALALASIKGIKGRKAIVVFTDGVDWHSDEASFDSTLRGLDEEGVIVYPIRYDTRAETEHIARAAMGDPVAQLPTIGVLRRPPPGTTPPTFPSDDPNAIPTTGSRPTPGPGPLGLPYPTILRRPTPDPTNPNGGNWPPSSGPTLRLPDPTDPRSGTRTERKSDDGITNMLDALYLTADGYLKALADRSGGRMLRADKIDSLPEVFASIAAELRTQYSLGYYPTNPSHDGRYRKIKITTNRKSAVVRARPGYSAPGGQAPRSQP
jgi:hypothetical protein